MPKAKRLQDQLKFSSCDPGWGKTVDAFLHYYLLNKGHIPYRHGGDYELEDLPAKAKVALLGDWGTGTEPANELLRQVAEAKPTVVFHLGDIYYSGTPQECQRFHANVTGILPAGTRVYTLAGNHDMYSGGAGYYWLVDQLKQQASYFCVGNAHWQFLAMDTGNDDFDPFRVESHAPALAPEEAEWHLAKIRQAGGRKTVLLSHHPLFSAFEPVAHAAVNEHLRNTFQGVLPDVSAWFWGHEHRLAIYDEYLGLKRGRCVGCSAIPVFTEDTFFNPKFGDVPLLKDKAGSGSTVRLGATGGGRTTSRTPSWNSTAPPPSSLTTSLVEERSRCSKRRSPERGRVLSPSLRVCE
jgi:predicted phosphodiesterase